MRKLFTGLMLALVGCTSTVGTPFDQSKINDLKPGVSTEKDAEALFGPPTSVVTGTETGRQLLTWSYAQGTITGGRAERLQLLFSPDKRYIQTVEQVSVQ